MRTIRLQHHIGEYMAVKRQALIPRRHTLRRSVSMERKELPHAQGEQMWAAALELDYFIVFRAF